MTGNVAARSEFEKGLTCMSQADFSQAAEAFSAAIKLDPKNARYYCWRADAYLNASMEQAAFEDVERALSLDPNLPDAMCLQALMLFRKNKKRQARELLSQALERHPDTARGYYYRALLNSDGHRRLVGYEADTHGIIADLTRAIELDGERAEYYLDRGLATCQLNTLAPQALRDFDRASEFSSKTDVLTYLGLGHAHSVLKNFKAAVENFTKVLALRPSAEAFYYRGRARIKLGERADAFADFKEAIEADKRYRSLRLYDGIEDFDFDRDLVGEMIMVMNYPVKASDAIIEIMNDVIGVGGTPIMGQVETVEPLEMVRIYVNQEQGGHWHYVSMGFSDLHGTSPGGEDGRSGHGFELTVRVPRRDEDTMPTWPIELMQYLARYVFATGNSLEPLQHLELASPVVPGDKNATVRAVAIVYDSQFEALQSASGSVEMLQVVGITADEYKQMRRWQVDKFLALLARDNPLLLLDPYRESILDKPDIQKIIADGMRDDGSSVGALYVLGLDVKQTVSTVEVSMNEAAVGDLESAMRGRIPYDRTFKLLGPGKGIVFEPSDESRVSKENDEGLIVVQLSAATADEIARTVKAKPATYTLKTIAGLKFVITRTAQ